MWAQNYTQITTHTKNNNDFLPAIFIFSLFTSTPRSRGKAATQGTTTTPAMRLGAAAAVLRAGAPPRPARNETRGSGSGSPCRGFATASQENTFPQEIFSSFPCPGDKLRVSLPYGLGAL